MAHSLAACTYPDETPTVGKALIDSDYVLGTVYGVYACSPFKWQYLVNLLCVLVWIIMARWLYDGYMRVRAKAYGFTTLADTLTKKDNPAIAIDFACFLLTICLITRGSLQDSDPADAALYFGGFFAYQTIGVALLLFAKVVNDRLILSKVNNLQMMVADASIAVACVEGGVTIATGLNFAAAAGGTDVTFGEGILSTLIYWLIGQVFLVGYGNAVDYVTSLPLVNPFATELLQNAPPGADATDATPGAAGATSSTEGAAESADTAGAAPGGASSTHATSLLREAAAGNIAAGLSVFFDYVHAGVLIAAPVYVGYSLLAWFVWVVLALGLVSPLVYLYLDHIILRGASYGVAILRQKNWGAAALMGCQRLLLALVLASAYKDNCSPSSLFGECVVKQPDSMVARLGVVALPQVFNWQILLNLLLLLLLIAFSKLVYFLRFALKDGTKQFLENLRGFSLDESLADPHNNAVAASLGAYTFAGGLTLVGVVVCPSANPGLHGAEILLWTAIGCVLLFLAFAINDFVLLTKVSNSDMLIANNLAVATFEAGSFLACGVILRANLVGGGFGYGEGIALTVVYWLLSQTLLLLCAYIYRCLTVFDDWQALRDGNVAAGVSGGLTLIALAICMSYSVMYYASILVFLPVAVTYLFVLMALRKGCDKFILPGDELDKEIVTDHNWGAALIEGAVAIGIALISNMYVPPPGPPFVSEDIVYFDVCA